MRNPEQSVAAYTYLRPAEVAERLNVSRSHVNELVRTGKLEAVNISLTARPLYRIAPAALDEYLKRQKVAA